MLLRTRAPTPVRRGRSKGISPTWPPLADRIRNMLGRGQVAGREEDLCTALCEGFGQ